MSSNWSHRQNLLKHGVIPKSDKKHYPPYELVIGLRRGNANYDIDFRMVQLWERGKPTKYKGFVSKKPEFWRELSRRIHEYN